MSDRAGYYRTNLSGDLEYKSFVPDKLLPNSELNIDGEIAL